MVALKTRATDSPLGDKGGRRQAGRQAVTHLIDSLPDLPSLYRRQACMQTVTLLTAFLTCLLV